MLRFLTAGHTTTFRSFCFLNSLSISIFTFVCVCVYNYHFLYVCVFFNCNCVYKQLVIVDLGYMYEIIKPIAKMGSFLVCC